VGLGMGRHHVACFKRHPLSEVAAVADPDESRRREIGEKYGVARRYETAEEMLDREALDIVVVVTPNSLHKPITVAALAAGCHVLCEKPMALNVAEAREMVAAARKAQRRLMINFSYRFTAAALALKREVDRGTLGEVYFARTTWLRRSGIPRSGGWFGQKAFSGGGPLMDLGSHRLDLALWFMGHPKPLWVMGGAYDYLARDRAEREGKPYDVEDFAVALIRFENGAMLEIESAWAAHIKERELMETRVLGTKAGLVHRNVNETYDFEAEVFLERDGVQYDMQPRLAPEEAFDTAKHFVDCIVENRPHTASGEEGLVVTRLLDAIYESSAKGEPVRVN